MGSWRRKQMPTNYDEITRENTIKYGTNVNVYGPLLLAKLYSDRTHFIYELLQNAEDAKATWVNFSLFKDKLEFKHNGRLFNVNDVKGICRIAESTKKDDSAQIGKFGIGFKSVFAYTNTPKIFSGDESFCIMNYVHPRKIEKEKIKDNETLFVFPFNHNEVSSDKAFEEISKRLQKLGSRILLFLNNIDGIKWEIENEEFGGIYTRKILSKKKNLRTVQVSSELKDNAQEEKGKWIIFERPTESDGATHKVEIAFKVDKKNTDAKKETKEVIVPVDDSYLVVFFPTEKETHLNSNSLLNFKSLLKE